MSRAHNIGCEMRWVSKEEAKAINPVMNFDSARCILYTPDDGRVDPTSVVMPLAQMARDNGAKISRFNRVTDIMVVRSESPSVLSLAVP